MGGGRIPPDILEDKERMDNQKVLVEGVLKGLFKNSEPSDEHIGILRVERHECPVHGLYSSLVWGYRYPDGREVETSNEAGCHYCIREKEEQMKQQRLYEQYRTNKVNNLMHVNGVSGIYEDLEVDSFFVNQLKEPLKMHVLGLALAWVEGSFRNLILTGNPGTGRTMLASIAINEACRNLRTAFYTTEQKLYREFRTLLSTPERESRLINHYGNIDFLAIDELGRSAGSEFEARILAEIIDDRYKNQKATMICTNMTKNELEQYLGDNIIRRIAFDSRKAFCDWPPYNEGAR